MIRRPPRSTLDRSAAASDVYKRQVCFPGTGKSHLAQALGQAAIQQGHRVLYREAHLLLEELTDATLDGTRKEVFAELSTVPVSYTHLRAHETVLDTVCRLLLEKQT